MRILVLTFQFPPRVGGVETMAFQLSNHLAQNGHSVVVVADEIQGAAKMDATLPHPIIRLDLGLTATWRQQLEQKFTLVARLNQIIHSIRPDTILCIHWDPCAYLVRFASWRSGRRIPYFFVAHGMELMQLPSKQPARSAKALLRSIAFGGAKKFFAVSQYTRARLVDLGVTPERVLVIPNGIEAKTTQEDYSDQKEVSARKKILTVSRLVPRKGHTSVLKALPLVLQEYPQLSYQIVGAGSERKRLEELTQELGLTKHVEFYGELSEARKDELLRNCDLFVLASRETATDFEGFGIAVLEAMEHGKPVVVTRAGGVPEIVDDGRTGFVVEPDTPEALARAILGLLQSPSRAAEMGREARRVVQSKYDWNVIAKWYVQAMTSSLGF
jgi:phosphatidyl-myo-inositol dimannoside synthase